LRQLSILATLRAPSNAVSALLAVSLACSSKGADLPVTADAVQDAAAVVDAGGLPDGDAPDDILQPDSHGLPNADTATTPDVSVAPDAAAEGDTSANSDVIDAPDTALGPDSSGELDAVTDPDTTPVPDTNTGLLCGNGVVDLGEACDDQGTGDFCAGDCQALVDVGVEAAYPARTSLFTLPSANGGVAVVARVGPGAPYGLDRFYEHPYRAYDAATVTRDLLYDGFFGYRTDQGHGWLKDVVPAEVGYEPGTGIVRLVQLAAGLRFESYFFAPMSHPERSAVALLRVENTSAAPVTGFSCHLLWNAHLGGEGVYDGESVTLDSAGPVRVIESRGSTSWLYEPLVAEGLHVTADAGGAHNPYALVAAGQGYSDYVPSGPLSDVAVGVENRLGTLAAGDVRWCGLVARLGGTAATPRLNRSPEAWLADERAFWADFHAVEPVPAAMTSEQRRVLAQSTAVIKMAQVTSLDACPSGKCAGQILASLPPGQWFIAWVRDQVYATLALLRTGHHAEATAAMEFLIRSDVQRDGAEPYYQKRFLESTDTSAGTWGMGLTMSSSVQLSLARYFGNGLEESDANAAGPNIEFDNLGLFLWAFAETVAATPDGAAFRHEHWAFASAGVADVLLELVDAATGLLVADSSIWERHFCPHGQCDEPETRKRHAYSAIHAANGLARMALLAADEGDAARASAYSAAATALRQALSTVLRVTPPGGKRPAIAGNVEELPYAVYYLDVAAIDAVALGLIAPGSPEAFGTVEAFDAHLRIGPHSPGYRRNDDPTWYDRQEWLFCDLRMATALTRMGQLGKAKTLVGWATRVALANHDLIPELLSDGVYQVGSDDDAFEPGVDPGGDAQGAFPMVGFGAGVYVLALYDLLGG
jgi:GH15 family glucan-1,4-alpha-glucosidase